MQKILLSSLSLLAYSSLLVYPTVHGAGVVHRDAVRIQVEADQTAQVSHEFVLKEDGFEYLNIQISNPSDSVLTIDEVRVEVPLEAQVSDEMEIVFGSSGMGRRPLNRQTVGEPSRDAYSFMYELLQLKADDYVFAGALSWRIFIPVISLKEGVVQVRSDGEGKQLQSGETIAYEQLVFRRATDWVQLLNEFGDAIALENDIQSLKDVNFTGWATWDYYGRVFTADDVLGNLKAVKALYPEANLIQIDGGWWTDRGDYTSVRGNLPGGIAAIAAEINDAGMMAGLHFDGFRGDMASKVYQAHPEYFLHDQDGNIIVETREKVDRTMKYIYFDYSHPGARAHIRACIETMKDWGIRYFKVDFMRYGLEMAIKKSSPHVESFRAYDSSLTGVERFRLGMQTIADAIGEENYFLGCSAVFGPAIGYVDGMRTGGDIHPNFHVFPERSLANSGNFYLDGRVFNGDCDYLVFREAADEDATVSKDKVKSGGSLSFNEAQMWADYNKLYGNVRLQSDNLMSLREARKQLAREVFEYPTMDEVVPLDLWKRGTDKHDGFELILGRHAEDIYLGVFNWSDSAKTYDLKAYGLDEALRLEGRHSSIIHYAGDNSFADLCASLSASVEY